MKLPFPKVAGNKRSFWFNYDNKLDEKVRIEGNPSEERDIAENSKKSDCESPQKTRSTFV